MNREETKKAIEVMQAYVDGKDLEHKSPYGKKWIQLSVNGHLSWDWATNKYRIKPQEPREFWVHPDPNHDSRYHNCVGHKPVNEDYIKVREVL